jgi:hypothetical protein
LLPYEPVTSTTQIGSAKTALKATAEMQPSADSNNINNASSFGDNPSSTFQLVVASVDWISKAVPNKPFKTLRLERIKSKMQPTFKLIFGFKQQYQSQLQQDLVDLSFSNTCSIAKLDSISIKAKANSAKLIDMLTSHQRVMIHLNNGSSQFVVKHIFLSGSEGAHTACRFIVELNAAAKGRRTVRQPTLASEHTPHFEGAGAPSGCQEYSVLDIAFKQSLPIKIACIAPATFDNAFKFIATSQYSKTFSLQQRFHNIL